MEQLRMQFLCTSAPDPYIWAYMATIPDSIQHVQFPA